MYEIPKKHKDETKFTKLFYLKDVLTFLASGVVIYNARIFVHLSLVIPYFIFAGITVVLLMLPSVSNPARRNYQAIYYGLISDRNCYGNDEGGEHEAKHT